jgi:hypothetical protein
MWLDAQHESAVFASAKMAHGVAVALAFALAQIT